MKFFVTSASQCSRRLGKITEIQRLPELSLETPLLMLYTKGGSIPHITHEVLQMVSREPLGIQVPVASTVHSEAAVREFKKGLAEFIGLKENLIYCTVQDSAVGIVSGFNDSTSVSVFTRRGRQQLDPESYMDIIEAFCPDMYQALHDGDTGVDSPKKRIQNSAKRTYSFTQACLERHKKSEVLRNKAILGVIEGGHSIAAREMCAKELQQQPFAGFVIDGLYKQSPEIENVEFSAVKEIIEKTLNCLPEDKFRVLHGCWNPDVVLDMVDIGIDVFDGSYPFLVTERGSALTFCNKDERQERSNAGKQSEGNDTKALSQLNNADNEIKPYEINLKDKKYFGDFGPISTSCSCLTCREHTKSYIHHLVSVNELLGTVLLMIHNLHHYMEFFRTIRKTIKENTWEDFREYFKQNLKS